MSSEASSSTIVNLRHKATEGGWAAIFDTFCMELGNLWFRWLGWMFAVGVLE